MQSDEILIVETSPNGNIEAFVEQDDRVAYFYLRGSEDIEFGVRSCWVRNLKPAPDHLDVHGMREGTAPMLPREYCQQTSGGPALNEDNLRIVWFEEGDAAALLENEDIIAVLPSWSGYKGFNGYARDCKGESDLCWELGAPETNEMFARVANARKYWQSWENDEETPWPQFQEQFINTYKRLGEYSNYYAIDGGEWPPRAMLRIPYADGTILVTLGLSIRPQPKVEMQVENPDEHRRIELGIYLSKDFSQEDVMQMAGYISGQASLPWAQYSWLGEGHTIPCNALQKSNFSAIFLTANPPGSPTLNLPTYCGDKIKLLWMVPITNTERDIAIENSSDVLAKRLWEEGVSWKIQNRKELNVKKQRIWDRLFN
jgi:hypothetical protein